LAAEQRIQLFAHFKINVFLQDGPDVGPAVDTAVSGVNEDNRRRQRSLVMRRSLQMLPGCRRLLMVAFCRVIGACGVRSIRLRGCAYGERKSEQARRLQPAGAKERALGLRSKPRAKKMMVVLPSMSGTFHCGIPPCKLHYGYIVA